jgi:hypothetical protein
MENIAYKLALGPECAFLPVFMHRRPAQSLSGSRAARADREKRALLLVDNRPLQREAWAAFHTARKRLEKVARDLHRHEQMDQPAYQRWIHQTFPVFITTLRELHAEVSTKAYRVQSVIELSEITGRSVKKLWREQQVRQDEPDAFEDDDFDEDGFDEEPDTDPDQEPAGARGRQRSAEADERSERLDSGPRKSSTVADEARAIYRRLVQQLHPDRGGEWTPSRKRLWHEVQQAWAAGDADWLARLEIEWETANDVLSPTSPLSRLRRAIEELLGARRDTERKLRDYRASPPWRFTLSPKKRAELHRRTEMNFRHDIEILQRQLAYLDATIAAWEDSARPPRRRR